MMNRFFMIAIASVSLVSVSALAAPVKLTLNIKGSTLNFDKAKLTVKAGQAVTLTVKDGAPKDSGLQHNWVLVVPGSDQDVATNGIGAGPEKGYIPDSPNILAHTKLMNPGESDTITFTAPTTTGDYPYLCTFPGHYPMMKGVLTVK